MKVAILLLIILKNFANSYTTEALTDKIEKLPGTDTLDFKFNQFSGYLPVNGSGGNPSKYLHYWFIESESTPSTDPIAFWTNGGPGCSGLIAFFTEHGPFRPKPDGNLILNPYTWNQRTNIVYIESPTGVGFSYSTSASDYKSSDDSTAVDNYNLIQQFFDRFPEYSTNSLYLTSESYGGHYIPILAKLIVIENKSPSPNKRKLNLKGIAIGNPYTDVYSGKPAMIETMWGHQLISWPLYNYYKAECDLSPESSECATLEDQALTIGNINPYGLDFAFCNPPKLSRKLTEVADQSTVVSQHVKRTVQQLWLLDHMYKHLSGSERSKLSLPTAMAYEPCEEDWTTHYLNSAEVKRAIHVKENITWSICSKVVDYQIEDLKISTAPIYNFLIDGGYNLDILIFSGDDDAVCSTLGTQKWIWSLGYDPVSSWNTYSLGGQTAGYLTKFGDGSLAFLTIHGAGHMVSAYQPAIAMDMWTKFIAGNLTKRV